MGVTACTLLVFFLAVINTPTPEEADSPINPTREEGKRVRREGRRGEGCWDKGGVGVEKCGKG